MNHQWPTPSVGDVTGGRTVPAGTSATGQTPHGAKVQLGLQTAVRASTWATFRAEFDSGRHRGTADTLHSQIKDWSTPTVNDAQNATAPPSQGKRNSEALAVQSDATVAAALSPAWVCQLMGFPDGWAITSGPPVAAKRSTKASARARRRASP